VKQTNLKLLALIVGIVCALLGGLWFLQGLGLVQIPPILCVAECTPLQGVSPTWAIVGFLTLAIGVLAIRYGRTMR
jgi:hypothetical protein